MNLPHSSLFAFDGFASLGMLWWGVLGGIPIVIHLLHKRKYRETTWAAMRFLIEAAKKNSRRIRIEQLILLMVRVLILVLLAFALAQPYMKSFGTFFQADVPIHRIIVIDTSFSMAYRANDFSRFERAKDVARKVVSSSRQGDALNLVRIGEMLPRVIVQKPAFQKSQVLGEIDDLKQSHESGNLLATLQDAAQLLNEAPDIEQKEIVFISDFQRFSWAPPTSDRRAKIRGLLRQMAGQASVSFLDVGQSAVPNVAVTAFSADEAFMTVGRPVSLSASVTNLGKTPVSQQAVELYVDGRLAQSRQVDMPPSQDVPVDFNYTFASAGEHRLEVRIQGDGLEIDNKRYLSLPVKDEINVLLVNGEPAGRPSDNATFYLEKALRPQTQNRPWDGVTRPTVIRDGELRFTELERYDCIMLCNIAQLTPDEVDLLTPYVEGGGGLVICLGDNVKHENYNEVLYQEGEGLLPVKLLPTVGDANNPDLENLFLFDPADLEHPIVNLYEGNPETGLANTFAFRYFPTEIPSDSRVTRVINFAKGGDQGAAILEAPAGQGRVVLFTTSVDKKWGAWPLQPQTSFLPIIHETVRFAVTGRWSDRQKQVGEPFTRTLRAFNVPVTILRPDNQEISERPTKENNLAHVSYQNTNLAGIYELQLGTPIHRAEWFAVNVDPRESSLDHVGEKELETELLPGVTFQHLTQWQNGPRKTDSGLSERGGLTRWLLMAVLCLVLVELLMAWQFSYGFALLGLIVALVMIGQFLAINPQVTGGVLIGLLIITAVAAYRRRTRQIPKASSVGS